MKNILLLLSAPFLCIEAVLIYVFAALLLPLCVVLQSTFIESKMVRWICNFENRCDKWKNTFL
jgi:hypothetical protein